MNGGSLSRVTSRPLSSPPAAPTATPMSNASDAGHAVVRREAGHDQHRQDHDGADRQVDAGGEDDEGLADGERRDHGHLLEQMGDHRWLRQPRIDDAEHDEGQDQHEDRADRRVGVQHVLNALHGRLTALRELLDSGRRSGSRCCHRASLPMWIDVPRHTETRLCRIVPCPTVTLGQGVTPGACGRPDLGGRSRLDAHRTTAFRSGSPQQILAPSLESMLSTPSTGLSVTSATPVLKKSRPRTCLRLGTTVGDLGDGLHAELRHLQRVLLRGRADDAGLDAGLTPGRSRRRPRRWSLRRCRPPSGPGRHHAAAGSLIV